MKRIFLSLLLPAIFAEISVVKAGPVTLPDPKAPADAVTIPPIAPSRWSVGAGVVFREIEGSFSLKSPGRLNPSFPRRGASGRGDVGFYTGGDGAVQYDDGAVGPQFDPADGTALTTVNSAGQISNSRTSSGTPFEIVDATFHSSLTQYAYSSSSTARTFRSDDQETGVGPYLELRYAFLQSDRVDVSALLGYSWVNVELASGTGLLGTHSIFESRTQRTFSYIYDHNADFSGITAPGTAFPATDLTPATIYDASTFNGFYGGNEQNPRRGESGGRTSRRTVAEYFATGSARLDVDLHEIVLAPEISLHLGQRVHVLLSAGPTVNFFNTDLDATAAWYAKGSNRPVKTYRVHESDSTVKLGVAAQVAVQVDITRSLFLQGSASYRHVDSFETGSGFARAKVDASSWQAAVGLGIRF
jgi:hypothetical protein